MQVSLSCTGYTEPDFSAIKFSHEEAWNKDIVESPSPIRIEKLNCQFLIFFRLLH